MAARMMPFTLAELAAITNGRPVRTGVDGRNGDTGIAGSLITGTVHSDSRRVAAGDVFVAMPGADADGHDFAAAAADAGAALLIVERELDLAVPQLVVASGVAALAALAREVVARLRALGGLTVLAVTGSNGKTTVKDLLGTALAVQGETIAPESSYNNHVGLPLTVLRATPATRHLVLEMGADKPGDIARLVRIARPDIAIELKVGLAHVGGFGSLEATQAAKAELVTGLAASDVAVLNADDSRVAAMADLTHASVVWFGTDRLPGPGWRADGITSSIDGIAFTAVAPDGAEFAVASPLVGEHQVANVLAVLAAADAAGADRAATVAAIATAPAPRWRMQVTHRADGVTIINDAYNSSPDSLAAALRTVAQLADGRRTVAVLGEMLELGDASGEEHDRIGELVVRLNIGQLVVVGAGARRLHISAAMEGSWDGESVYAQDADAAERELARLLRPGDLVLVKSSYGAGLRFLGDRLANGVPA